MRRQSRVLMGVVSRPVTPETRAVIFGTKKSWVRIPPPRPSYRSQFSGDSARSEFAPYVELQTRFANTAGTKRSHPAGVLDPGVDADASLRAGRGSGPGDRVPQRHGFCGSWVCGTKHLP